MKGKISKFLALSFSIQMAAIVNVSAQIGTWTALTNVAPHENMGVMLLLTNGTVMCHDTVGGTYGTGWDILTPDASGSYANGTWTSTAPMNNDRLFFSSQVLPSGDVYVAGGEYGPGGKNGEVYNPFTNTWTVCGPIPNGWNIYDGNSEILYNGNVLEGPQIGSADSYNILQWSPTTLNYTQEANAPLNHDEAEWVKLPDSSVLYVGIASQNSCRFLPKYNRWHNDNTVPVKIFDPYGEESGCGTMLPNGTAIMFGATQNNAIYTPTGDTNSGTWTAAANFPTIGGVQVGQPDASGAMMVNGHELLAVSPVGTSHNDEFRNPAYFLEYDYTTNTFTQVTSIIPGWGADSLAGIASYMTQMLDLPDGNVLVSISQAGPASTQYYIYTPGSAAIPQGKPTINSILPDGCPKYKITGKLFNGISEGASYGDDWQMSTNWPIVRLSNGTNVYYATTSNWNRVGAVQTDSLEDTAVFVPPASLPAGTYSLVVVVNGFASNPVIFKTLSISIASQANIKCNGGTGSATANAATGGISPYTYLWSPGGGTNLSVSNLSVGTYTIQVTDNNGCTATASVTITQPAVLDVTTSVTNVSCNGGNNGVASSTVTGGTSPYTYAWSGGGSNANKTGLSIGTYTININDANGCTASATAVITQPSKLSVTATTTVNEICGGGDIGSVTSVASGGTSPYTYAWTGGGTNFTYTGLTAGTYTITLTDNNGCTATASTTITQPVQLTVTDTTIANEPCNGDNSGVVSSTPIGGTTPYTYAWSGGGNASTKSGLSIGTYTITLTDKNGCTATASATVTQPNVLTAAINIVSEAGCGGSNGSLSSVVSGGTLPYSYSWTGGSTSSTLSSLSGGTYTLSVTDNNGCNATASATITQPTKLSLADSVISNVKCFGENNGSASAIPSGGTAPYTYLWTGGSTNSTATGLTAGNYTVTVTDGNGCSGSATVSITQPTQLGLNAGVTDDVACHGGNDGIASSNPSGGTMPYTYLWTGGSTQSSATGLTAGTYTISLTDHNGCTATATAIIAQPAALSIMQGSTTTSASNCIAIAWVGVTGGTFPYTYDWTPGGGTTDTIINLCAGSYCCKVTDMDGCIDSVCINVVTGIDEINNSSAIHIYPDPNNGNFTVSGALQGQVIELYNYLGQLITSTVAGNSDNRFDISGSSNGLYLIRIINQDGSMVTQKKIIKTQ